MIARNPERKSRTLTGRLTSGNVSQLRTSLVTALEDHRCNK